MTAKLEARALAVELLAKQRMLLALAERWERWFVRRLLDAAHALIRGEEVEPVLEESVALSPIMEDVLDETAAELRRLAELAPGDPRLAAAAALLADARRSRVSSAEIP